MERCFSQQSNAGIQAETWGTVVTGKKKIRETLL